MAFTRKKKIVSSALLAVVALAGYGIYQGVFAVQGQGALAQAPMNVESSAPPAFIMGVDNSGSMSTDETLFRTSDGVGRFSGGSFFNADGTPRESGTSISRPMDQASYYSDMYAALRAPEYNRAYFNPGSTYTPWVDSNGVPEPDSSITAASEDPRGSGRGAANPFTTFDFTKNLESTETWLSGKTMPKGTTYYNDNTCNRAPGSNRTQNNWVTLTQDLTFSSNCYTKFKYYPARVYLSDSATPPAGFDLTKRVWVPGVGPQGIGLWRYDYLASNFTSGGAAAIQNFANWWTYYGNRNRSMIAAMTHALSGVSRMRVGYFTINPTPPSGNVTMYDMSDPASKATLYATMRNLNASGNTPTRTATAYMVKQFFRTDGGAPVMLQCQKNAGMLFTDGYTNETNNGSGVLSVGDSDYSMPPPYGGGVPSSNTIADYAMYGYLNNLRPDLPVGRVLVPDECKTGTAAPGTDCNANLHMNFYGVTLGARGAIYEVNMAATNDPYANSPSWGATGTMNLDPRNVDDIWHASLNSRGEFINAQSPAEITAAMRRILSAVGAGASPSGSISATGARVGANSFSISPFYEATNNGTDWYGKLTAQTVASNSITGVVSYAQLWEASAMLPASTARNVWFGRYAGASAQALRFSSSNVTLANLCTEPTPSLSVCDVTKINDRLKVGGSTGTPITATQAVSYLLGDQSLESDTLRKRTTRLGDIVNSSPAVAAPTDDYGYRSMAGATAGSYDPYNYSAYLTAKQSRPRVVFAGANDGMLHAFDGATGVERFGYIPTTALGHMGNLLFPYNAADKNTQIFQHRYFVDGQIAVSDAYAGGAWKTVLVGAAGAGGRGVFGLDVSNPASFTGASVLWEVNDRSSNATIADNIGYVLGKPVIVPVKTSGGTVAWKAIFGNGYNSNNGKAVLFVVDVGTGAVQTIQANEAGAPSGTNGLGSIVVVDNWSGTSLASRGRDGYADTVYAADQKGAVWKFDLRPATPANQTVPVFVTNTDSTGVRQPILGGLAAAAAPNGGVMVFFGTGSFSFEGDATDLAVQSIYGVQDRPSRTTTLTRSNLTAQVVGTVTGSGDTRSTSMNPLGAGKLGWYMDLPAGERVVSNPRIESGILFMPTYLPDITGTSGCASNGSNWLYGLDALSGAAGLMGVRVGSPTGDSKPSGSGAIKLETGGSAPVTDTAAFVSPRIKPLSAAATATEVDNAIAAQCSMVVQAPGAQPLYVPRACGRQSWRQIK